MPSKLLFHSQNLSFTLNLLEYHLTLYGSVVFKVIKVKHCDVNLGRIKSYLSKKNVHGDKNGAIDWHLL